MEVLKQLVQLIWLVGLESLVSLSDGSCKRVSRMCFSFTGRLYRVYPKVLLWRQSRRGLERIKVKSKGFALALPRSFSVYRSYRSWQHNITQSLATAPGAHLVNVAVKCTFATLLTCPACRGSALAWWRGAEGHGVCQTYSWSSLDTLCCYMLFQPEFIHFLSIWL